MASSDSSIMPIPTVTIPIVGRLSKQWISKSLGLKSFAKIFYLILLKKKKNPYQVRDEISLDIRTYWLMFQPMLLNNCHVFMESTNVETILSNIISIFRTKISS